MISDPTLPRAEDLSWGSPKIAPISVGFLGIWSSGGNGTGSSNDPRGHSGPSTWDNCSWYAVEHLPTPTADFMINGISVPTQKRLVPKVLNLCNVITYFPLGLLLWLEFKETFKVFPIWSRGVDIRDVLTHDLFQHDRTGQFRTWCQEYREHSGCIEGPFDLVQCERFLPYRINSKFGMLFMSKSPTLCYSTSLHGRSKVVMALNHTSTRENNRNWWCHAAVWENPETLRTTEKVVRLYLQVDLIERTLLDTESVRQKEKTSLQGGRAFWKFSPT